MHLFASVSVVENARYVMAASIGCDRAVPPLPHELGPTGAAPFADMDVEGMRACVHVGQYGSARVHRDAISAEAG